MPFIYLDESGQFNKHNDEKYFIIASFTIGNPRRTKKAIRSWFHDKFPRKMCVQPEIKFSDKKIPDDLRLKTLKHISDLDVRIRYVYLLRNNIPDNFKRGEKIKSGELYTQIIGELLEMYTPINDFEFRVFCDQRNLKGITRSEFKRILRTRLLPLVSKNCPIEIEMIDSTTDTNIQIADWIVGALAWYLEDKPLGKKCFDILKNNFLNEGKELFKNESGK
jgi:hypothetical protein